MFISGTAAQRTWNDLRRETLETTVPSDACTTGGLTVFGDNLGYDATAKPRWAGMLSRGCVLAPAEQKRGALNFVGRDNRCVG
jgi:hypothetical protein